MENILAGKLYIHMRCELSNKRNFEVLHLLETSKYNLMQQIYYKMNHIKYMLPILQYLKRPFLLIQKKNNDAQTHKKFSQRNLIE